MAERGEGSTPEAAPVYHVPTARTLEEIKNADEEDESLNRYKAALLGNIEDFKNVPFPNNPKCVIIDSFSICVDGEPEKSMDLKGDLSKLKDTPVIITEGSEYHIKVTFYVQREIVTGLQYDQKSYRAKVRFDHSNGMLGSYGPRKEPREWKSDTFQVPTGALYRGTYSVTSQFTDVDKTDHLSWKWTIKVTKSNEN